MSQSGSCWSGTLCLENIDGVAGRLRALLSDKRFTVVVSSELRGYKPEVATALRLKPGERFSVYSGETSHKGFNFSDTRQVWMLSTTQKKAAYDGAFNAPYLEFNDLGVTITLRAPNGQKLYWVFAIEPE